MKKYLKMTARIIAYMVIYFIILTAVQLALVFVAKSNEVFKNWLVNNLVISIIINDIIALILFGPLVKLINGKKLFEQCKFTAIKINTMVVVSIVAIFSGILTSCFFNIPSIKAGFPVFETSLSFMLDGSFILFISFLLIGSVYKEILFRGLIFSELKSNLNLFVALIIQSAIYGLLFFNFNIPLSIYGALGAILFALLYVWYGSLWASVVAQIGSTGGLYLARKFGANFITEGNLYYIMGISFVIVVVGIYYLWKNKQPVSNI